jgi:putative ABC transport system permease protein
VVTYYFKTAVNEIKRHRSFSALNVFGLMLGISSCLLITMYINFELGFDKFHKNERNIYRVVMRQPGNLVKGSSSEWWVVSPYILKPTWETELPEIQLACRISEMFWSFKNNDQYLNEEILVIDPEFFDLFTFPLKAGNKKDVLSDPYSIVISQKMASKYFGEEDPVGKKLLMNNGKVLNVTGILEKVPENSHLKFDFLVSFKTIESMNGRSLIDQNWLHNSYRTYLILKENTNLSEFDTKLTKYDLDGFNGKKWSFHVQPLADIHFNKEIRGAGDKETLYILIAVGFLILFLTGFNYMNLFVAHYISNIKNITVRRFSGADRRQLMLQFMGESFLLVLISYLLSIVIVFLVLPVFNQLTGEQIDFRSIWHYKVLAGSIGIVFLMALISGMYPAYYLSGLQIIDGIKGGMEKFSKGAMTLRKGIMIIQFSISVLLLVGTITIYKQMKYVSEKSLGYKKENIISMSLEGMWYEDTDGIWKNRIETLKQELLKNSNITRVAGSSGIPSKIGWSNIPLWEGQSEGDNPFFYRLSIDEDFLGLFGIEIVQGRGFSKEMSADRGNSYMLNEAAVKSLGLKNPIGSRFGFDKKLGTIVGVVKDFHFESLHKPITPLGIDFNGSDNYQYLSLSLNSNNIPETMRFIEKTWSKLANNAALKYTFADEQLEQLYTKDNQLAERLNYFSFIALFISCLGIFGIMSISIRERTKELGIRKVVGAPFKYLVWLMLKDYFAIIGIASILGGLLGMYAANQWLRNFEYRISFGIDIIILSSLIALLMAVIPVGYRLWKAIINNPVESIRND